MPYRKPYKGYLDDIQDISNKLGTIHADIAYEKTKEAEAIRGIIKQIKKLNNTLRALFDRLELANKYYGREGDVKE